jgi:hypothetical protein
VRELLPEIWRWAQGSAELSMLQTARKCGLARTFIAAPQQWIADEILSRAKRARLKSHRARAVDCFYFFG